MNWQPHLNVLKTFVDGCGQYAGMIKRQALAPALPYFSSGTVPVDTAIEAFAQMGVIPAEIKASFEAAYQMRDGASAEKDITAKKSLFLDGGNLFLALAGSIEVATFDSVEARAKALFFAKMEAGFCLLATEEREKIAAAINIYAEAESRYPNDPIPLYRHAVALSELNEFETAEAKYSQAQDALDNDTTIPAEHWLRQALPRRRGFLHWLMANECANDEKGIERRKALLERACELTRNALSLSQAESLGEFRSGNNLLYYLLDLNYGNSSENVIVSPELNRCIGILESRFSVATAGRDRLSELDTLCRAYAMMGRFAEAVLAAERIENALANAAESSREIGEAKSMPLASAYYSITENLNPAERRILDHALWVLRNYGPGREGEETSG
jgi:tetratricopeptide (TPR) repeat protein